VEESLLYVEPMYLAAEKGSIPELKRVFVAYANQIAMEETLEASLQAIFGRRPTTSAATRTPDGPAPPAAAADGVAALVGRAWEAWTLSQESLRRGDWSAYGDAQRRLEEALRGLRERAAAPAR
jgi:uncharacterized membrane protein (UPF0182 family)